MRHPLISRYAVGLATLTTCAAVVLAGAPGAMAAPGAATGASRPPAAQTASGFAPVHTPAGVPVKLFTPRAGELWVLEHDAQGKALLEHYVDHKWSTTALATDAWAGDIAGAQWCDLWLVASGTVWHYDGASWTSVPGPVDATGAPLNATKVAVSADGTAYVGTFSAGVFRRTGDSWTPLGKPPAQGSRFGQPLDTYWPQEMRFVDGTLFVVFDWFAQRALGQLWSYEGGAWVQQMTGLSDKGAGYSTIANAYVRAPEGVLVLGESAAGNIGVVGPYCRVWTGGTAVQNCTTSEAVGGAVTLSDGYVVIGGDDHASASAPGTTVQGRFVTRDAGGRETALPGDPGDSVLGMVVEDRTDTVWAATKAGDSYTLQRREG